MSNSVLIFPILIVLGIAAISDLSKYLQQDTIQVVSVRRTLEAELDASASINLGLRQVEVRNRGTVEDPPTSGSSTQDTTKRSEPFPAALPDLRPTEAGKIPQASLSNSTQRQSTTATTSPPPISSANTSSFNPQEQACLDLSASTAAFAKAVHAHAETTSLRTFVGTNPQGHPFEFPPLDHSLLKSAFGSKVIFMVGDSTLFYMLQKLAVLAERAPVEMIDSLAHKDLTPAYEEVTEHLRRHNIQSREIAYLKFNKTRVPPVEKRKTPFVFWSGFRGPSVPKNCHWGEEHNPIWKKMRHTQPDVVVANWGLHMFFRPKGLKPCNVDQWFGYEEFLERFIEVAIESNVKLLLFKTTNHLCDEQVLEYKEKSFDLCQEMLQEWMHDGQLGNHITDMDTEHYCDNGLMRDQSANMLNLRMAAVVKKAQRRTDLGGLKIALYNDHDMQTCQYTGRGDGRHYHVLQWPRIRLLAHMVQCLLPQPQSSIDEIAASS